jgi:dienelactone hydrolase
MAEVVLFHHALGLTPGVTGFGEKLRSRGHVVHVPDLYQGRSFQDLEGGVAHADDLGMREILRRARAAVEAMPGELIYAGFSLGALPAQGLAQTRPGARGVVLFHGGVTPATFESPWPRALPLQVHVSETDPWSGLDEIGPLVEAAAEAELFVYPGSAHLFADPGSGEHQPDAALLSLERTLAFLERLDAPTRPG